MKKKKKGKRSKAPLIILLSLLFVLVCAFVAGIVIFRHYYTMTNYEKTEEAEEAPSDVLETAETVDPDVESSIEESIAAAQAKAKEAAEKNADGTDKIYNLLLVGVDRRDSSWNGNSDAMILMTINYTDKKVTLTSFMRDTGVQVEGYGLKKLNFAYAIGGPSKLIETLQSNFGVTVDNYAWVDFDSMQAIIDNLGGVDLYLTVKEAEFCGISIASDQVVHLDGEHALKHARDRFSGGNDYMRTQRQRDVIMALVNKAKDGVYSNLVETAEAVLPYINHNIDQKTLLTLMTKLPTIMKFDFVQQRIPYDDLYYSQNELLIPDYDQTIEKLYNSIHD